MDKGQKYAPMLAPWFSVLQQGPCFVRCLRCVAYPKARSWFDLRFASSVTKIRRRRRPNIWRRHFRIMARHERYHGEAFRDNSREICRESMRHNVCEKRRSRVREAARRHHRRWQSRPMSADYQHRCVRDEYSDKRRRRQSSRGCTCLSW